MLGHLMEWFFSGLGGIRQAGDSNGYDHVLINPEPVGNITWAETSYQSIHGEIFCSWKIRDNNFVLRVRIPANCTATIVLPQADADRITESNIPVRQSAVLKIVGVVNGKTLCEVSSGEYIFQTEGF